jgi:UDP-2,4-diacetamido-2,4,6-trideoxy-beta-L-altropyranose hydrolase
MKFFFKAEANNQIGGGHLHRCISIAKECVSQGHEVAFIFADSSNDSIAKITHLNWEIHSIPIQKELHASVYLKFIPEGSLILFDTDNSEFYSGELIDLLRFNNLTTACYTITDQFPITTDIIVNTNIISQTHTYNCPNYTQFILGPEFLIFNPTFRNSTIAERVPNKLDNLLLFFGNADPNNLTQKVVSLLNKIATPFKKINVLVGGLNPNMESIKTEMKKATYPISLHQNITDMSQLYEQTDFAITAAGMSMWEMALYKIPQMVIASSDRETTYSTYMHQRKFFYLLGNYKDNISEKLLSISIDKFIENDHDSLLNLDEFKNLLNPNGIANMVHDFVTFSTK